MDIRASTTELKDKKKKKKPFFEGSGNQLTLPHQPTQQVAISIETDKYPTKIRLTKIRKGERDMPIPGATTTPEVKRTSYAGEILQIFIPILLVLIFILGVFFYLEYSVETELLAER
ncbi:MAG: hypothetical protein N0E55_08540 [Candidatus Thiodiazotropha taylori]|nr:hypothetical protein [Candidatus Thiodiazotropha taylori]MCW4252740.1 hypothetical protein [Candidatus Thiodiazotropha taylori]